VHATQIAAWRKQALERLSEVFDNGSPALADAEHHIRELRCPRWGSSPWSVIFCPERSVGSAVRAQNADRAGEQGDDPASM
jgi:hypothetical protein